MSSTYAKRGGRRTGEELTLGFNTGGRASNGTNNRLWSSKKNHLPSVILLRACITRPNRQKGARRRPASERPCKMGPDVAEFLLILKKSTRTSYSLVKDHLAARSPAPVARREPTRPQFRRTRMRTPSQRQAHSGSRAAAADETARDTPTSGVRKPAGVGPATSR
jgi:hypothetical protein